eukprot:39253_1
MPVRLRAKQQRTTINKSLKKNNRGGARTKKKRGCKRKRSPSISRLNKPRQIRKYNHQYHQQKTKQTNKNSIRFNTKKAKTLNKKKKHETNASYYAENRDRIKETYHQNKPKKQYNPYSKLYDVG